MAAMGGKNEPADTKFGVFRMQMPANTNQKIYVQTNVFVQELAKSHDLGMVSQHLKRTLSDLSEILSSRHSIMF